MVTVDILLLRYLDERLEMLLIRRRNPPFKDFWAFPGGYVERDETLPEAARRELLEETSLTVNSLFPLLIADQPGRDPRGRTISHLFCSILSPPFGSALANDDAAATEWFPLNHPPYLAFDHADLLERARRELQFHFNFKFRLLAFFKNDISRNDLQKILEELGSPSNSVSLIIEKALQLGLIKKSAGGHYEKRVSDEELFMLKIDRLVRIFYEKEH